MALSDMQVFQETMQTARTEVLDQQVQLFNAATGGAIILQSTAHEGDYSETALYAKIPGLVRRRNAYGSGAVAAVGIQQLLDRSVKVAAGTPPVEFDSAQFTWIQKNPEEAGVIIGEQLAGDTLQDMLNVSLNSFRVASGTNANLVNDVSGGSKASLIALNDTARKFGDAAQDIITWVMHSQPMHDIYGEALANANQLFQFGTVQVVQDGFGRPLVMTDSPSLITTPVGTVYHTLGLTAGGILVGQNNDFEDVLDIEPGDENIKRTYQAEWTYNLGMRGYQWDEANGGPSPNDAALGTGTNWDQYATSDKHTAGVQLISD